MLLNRSNLSFTKNGFNVDYLSLLPIISLTIIGTAFISFKKQKQIKKIGSVRRLPQSKVAVLSSLNNNTTFNKKFNDIIELLYEDEPNNTPSDLIITNLKVNLSETDDVILNNISFKLSYGECHGIVGKNGSGKSTILKVLAGDPSYTCSDDSVVRIKSQSYKSSFENTNEICPTQIKANSNPIKNESLNSDLSKINHNESQISQNSYINLLKLDPEDRAYQGILLLFQNSVEVPGVQAEDFFRTIYNKRRQRMGLEPKDPLEFNYILQKILKLVDLHPSVIENRGLNEGLSGGEKKKCEMIQLLLLRPRILLLDELDSGLDADALRTMSKLLMAYRETQNPAVLIVSHRSSILRELSLEKVLVLNSGNLVTTAGIEIVDKIDTEGYDFRIQ